MKKNTRIFILVAVIFCCLFIMGSYLACTLLIQDAEPLYKTLYMIGYAFILPLCPGIIALVSIKLFD